MKNDKLAKLFSKVREKQEPKYSRINISAPKAEVSVEKAEKEINKGMKVKHPHHGTGEVKAMLFGGKYASVKFDGHDGKYEAVKVSDLSPHSETDHKGKLSKFLAKSKLAKARVDEGKSDEDKAQARSARHLRVKDISGKQTGFPEKAPDDTHQQKGVHSSIIRWPFNQMRQERNLADLKAMPKPNLPKSEKAHMNKAERPSAIELLRMLLSKKEMKKKMAKASPENMSSAQLQGIKVPQPKAPKMTQKPIKSMPQMPKPKMGGGMSGGGMKPPKMKV